MPEKPLHKIGLKMPLLILLLVGAGAWSIPIGLSFGWLPWHW